MMEDNIFLDDFIFYVLDNQVAIGIDNLPIIAQNIIYDGKNTLILQTSENKNYILQNIVLEVRQLLKNNQPISIILTANHLFFNAYELNLQIDETLQHKDPFFDQSAELYQDLIERSLHIK